MKRLRYAQTILILALVADLSFLGLSMNVNQAIAAGYGARCLNRHDATIAYTLIKSAATNYTGSGDEQIAASLWGYDISIFVRVNNSIMMNEQADTTNGSIFFANDVYGQWFPHCYYNIDFNQYTWVVFQSHPANLTGYTSGHQVVTISTGTSSGQYNVSWIG